MEATATQPRFSVRKIVIAGVLAALQIVFASTGIGLIPVPTPAGNATILHIPAIIGGILEGPLVGGLIGLIFGIFSFLRAENALFKDPLVAILPRIFIGITAYLVYTALRKSGVAWALVIAGLAVGLLGAFSSEIAASNVSGALLVAGLGLGLIAAFVYIAFKQQGETTALIAAAIVGTLTNTVLVLTLAVISPLSPEGKGYLKPEVALGVGITHGVPEIIVAVIITLAVIGAWKGIESGAGRGARKV